MARSSDSTDLSLVDHFGELAAPTIEDYCAAAAEYITEASRIGPKRGKTAQIRLSKGLSKAMLASLRETGLSLKGAVAGERTVGGGLRRAKADLSDITEIDGLKLAVEIKPVHLAVARAVWNRFGDIRIFAVNVHLKFPFAVVGGILTLPTTERARSGRDDFWKPTTPLIERVIGRSTRACGRQTEGDAPHLLEGIGVVVFDRESGKIDAALPAPGSGLRWQEFIDRMAETYKARFGGN